MTSDVVSEVDQAFTPPADAPTRLRVLHGARFAQMEEIEFPPANQYRLEAEGFGQLIAAGHHSTPPLMADGEHGLPEMPLIETLDNMATIEALLRSARAGHPMEVER